MDRGDDGGGRPSPWGGPRADPARFGRRLLILAGAVALGLFALSLAYPPSLWLEGQAIQLVRVLLVGSVVLVSLAASRRSLGTIAGQVGAWLLVMMALVALYGYRFELGDVFRRIGGELMPTRGVALDPESVSFTRASDGQFWIDAVIDNRPVRLLLDTGASTVVLTRADAARLGFAAGTLSFTQIFETANGQTRGAPVVLAELRIGPLTFERVPASVNEGALVHSLLGMRLLERLSSIEIRNDRLTIRR